MIKLKSLVAIVPCLFLGGVVVAQEGAIDPDISHPDADPSNPEFQIKSGSKSKKGMKFHSRSFEEGGELPSRYSCDGGKESPEFSWQLVPKKAKSLVLVMKDMDEEEDGAKGVNMVVFNYPTDLPLPSDGIAGLAPGIMNHGLPASTRIAKNSTGEASYLAPCPEDGTHTYKATLFVLDSLLPFEEDEDAPGWSTVEKAMQAHIIDKATLTFTYERNSAFSIQQEGKKGPADASSPPESDH